MSRHLPSSCTRPKDTVMISDSPPIASSSHLLSRTLPNSRLRPYSSYSLPNGNNINVIDDSPPIIQPAPSTSAKIDAIEYILKEQATLRRIRKYGQLAPAPVHELKQLKYIAIFHVDRRHCPEVIRSWILMHLFADIEVFDFQGPYNYQRGCQPKTHIYFMGFTQNDIDKAFFKSRNVAAIGEIALCESRFPMFYF